MITSIALIGLAALAIILWKPLSVIPIAFATYFLAVTFIPSYLGYAVSADYLQGKEAYVITGVGKQYLLVVLEGESEPRLVMIPPSDEADEAAKRAKDGASIIRFGKQDKGVDNGDSETQNGGATSVEIVEIKDSKILKKDYE